MFGNTITLDLSDFGSVDPFPKVLERVNQDNYSSEYRLKDVDREHVLLIRHTKENNKLKGKSVDRHNVTYTQNIFPTELSPQGETVQAYSVIRVNPERPTDETAPLVNAVMRFTEEFGSDLINWKS